MHFLCTSDGLAEGQSRAFEAAGLSLFAVRRLGQVYLYRNRCPHRGIALSHRDDFLDDSASLIHCRHHAALFLIESGECVTGPCEGQALEALACCEDGQGIWFIDRAAPAKAGR